MMYSWDGCSNISISFRTDLYSAPVPDRCGRADCLSQWGRPSFLFHRPGKCKSGTNNPGGYLELFMAGRFRYVIIKSAIILTGYTHLHPLISLLMYLSISASCRTEQQWPAGYTDPSGNCGRTEKMKKTTRKIMSILIACVMVLGTLSAACLPVRAEEENSAAVPAETVREAEPEAAAPETADAQPGETVSDAGREDGAAPAAAPEAASAQSEEKRRQQTGRRKQGQEEFCILLSGLKKRWMGLPFVYLPEKVFSRKGPLCLWNAFLTANSRPSDLLWKIHVPRM